LEKKKRVDELDIIKGFGILIIAIYHLVYRPQDGIPDMMIKSLGWALIALYFMISGYTFKPGKTVIENYKRRLLGLILPVFLGELLLLGIGGIYCRLVHGYNSRDVLHDAAVTFLRPEITTKISSEWGEGGILFCNLSPVWYIWALAWTLLIFYPLAKLVSGRSTKVWLAVVLGLMAVQIPLYLFVEPLPWSLIIVPLFTVFMLIGVKIKESGVIERLREIPLPVTIIYTIVFFAAHFGLFVFGGNEGYYISVIGTRGWLDVPLAVLQLLVAFPAFFGVARLMSMNRFLLKRMRWFGQHSLTILIWHCLFGLMFEDLLGTYNKLGDYWYMEFLGLTVTPEIFWKSAAVFVLSILCCIPVAAVADFFAVRAFESRLLNRNRKKELQNPELRIVEKQKDDET